MKANWLYVNAGTFDDSSPHSWENKITISTGGEDLLEFQNLGIVSYSDTQVIYKSRARFGFEATAYTSVGFRDQYPNINLDNKRIESFFRVARKTNFQYTSKQYNVEWREISLGTAREHQYTGTVPITVGIKDLTGNAGSLTLNGETFSIPEYTSDILQVKVVSLRDGEVGNYRDLFTNVNDVSEGSLTYKILSDDFSDSQKQVVAYLNENKIGWIPGNVIKGQTLFQSVVDGSQVGSTFHNVNPAQTKFMVAPVYINLQPEIYEYVQYNKIRYADIRYIVENIGIWPVYVAHAGDIEILNGPATRTAQKRIIAINTKNPYLHWDFEAEVEFYATVQSTAELTQAILNDPYLKRGDMVWDTSFTGDYKVEQTFQTSEIFTIFDDLFGGILNFIIIIVIVGVSLYIFIQIGIPLIRRQIIRNTIRKTKKEGD